MKNSAIYLFHAVLLLLLAFTCSGYSAQEHGVPPIKNIMANPGHFTPSDQIFPVGKYVNPSASWWTYFASGTVIKSVVIRDLSHVGSPPLLGMTQTYSLSCEADLLISDDAGATFKYYTVPCLLNTQLTHTADTGSVRYFDTEILSLSFSWTDFIPYMLRESPTLPSRGRMTIASGGGGGGYTISSFFDIFTEVSVDGGATWNPAAQSGMVVWTCPPEFNFPTADYFPLTGRFTGSDTVMWPTGVLIRNFNHQFFTASFPPPALGVTQSHSFGGTCDFDISYDGGSTWTHTSAPTTDNYQITHTDDDGTASFFNTEMLMLDISGGGLPLGVRLRESPTLASTGRLTSRSEGSGYNLESFFDVFFELSLDNGLTWQRGSHSTALNMGVLCSPITLSPPSLADGNVGTIYNQIISASGGTAPYVYYVTSGTIPHNCTFSSDGTLSGKPDEVGTYSFTVEADDYNGCAGTQSYSVSIYPQPYFTASTKFPQVGKYEAEPVEGILYPAGILIRNFALRDLTHFNYLPPPAMSQIYPFSCTADFEISYDGGATWGRATAPGTNTARVTHTTDVGLDSFFDTEMLAISISGGDLPAGVMIRESPTLASLGKMKYMPNIVGNWVSSFFDIFTELSLDGGASWMPGNSLTVTWMLPAEHFFTSSDYPPNGNYVSKSDEAMSWANGARIKNLQHHAFTFTSSLPPLGGNKSIKFDGFIAFELSTDGGLSWNRYHTTSTDIVKLTHTDDDGLASFYETEMQELDIVGGNLPGSLMIRESPSRISSGRAAVRSDGMYYPASGFFDIFTEISLDGGSSWSPSAGPQYVYLEDGPQTLEIPMAAKWNLVSVPSIVDDYTKSVIYPTSVSSAYRYSAGYIDAPTLGNGIGYWLKFDSPDTIDITGFVITFDSIHVIQGWNMIGSISYPVAVSTITASSPTLTTSQFFRYQAGYAPTDTIWPGKGYWVKASESGYLYLSAAPALQSKIIIVPTSDMPPLPPGGDLSSNTQETPKAYSLEQNYPNPFNPSTMLKYSLPAASDVRLVIFNTLGQIVATLAEGLQDAGYKETEWNAYSAASGIYFYRLDATSVTDPTKHFSQVRKMVLVK
jgi:hypothetical protein